MGGEKTGYWEKRIINDKASSINKTERFIRTVQKKAYQEALKEIQDSITSMYQKFADGEKITLAEAKHKINSRDFKNIDFNAMSKAAVRGNQALKEKADRLPDEVKQSMSSRQDAYESMLKEFTRKGELSQLQLRQTEIEQILLKLYDKNQINMYDLLSDQYQDGYNRGIFQMQQRLGYGWEFGKVNEKAVNKAILNTYGKSNYSQRLWEHRKNLSKDLRENLSVGLIRGENLNQMSRRIAKRMEVDFSNAKRLVRTETAYIYEQSAKDSYEECGIKKYEYLATLDGRTSTLCQRLDGKTFFLRDAVPGKNFPPMHPNCRSTTVCAFDEDVVTSRIAKKGNGAYYEVPSNMGYEEWKKSYGMEDVDNQKYSIKDTLSIKDKYAIMKYTGFKAYTLNDTLRSGQKLSKEDKMLVGQIDRALDKMPEYQGNLVRHLNFYDKESVKEFVARHVPGSTVTYKEYTSTSVIDGYSDTPDVKIYINESRKGRDIRSFNDRENEVLYKRNAKFVVESIVEQDGLYHILLEEA